MRIRRGLWLSAWAGGLLYATVALYAAGVWAHSGGGHAQCQTPQGEPLKLTVHGGRDHAQAGEVFGFDVETLRVRRCQPVEITFVNDDPVRHALMVDGLEPMFMIELPGRGRRTASFVAPDEDVTLKLHCHVPGHERAGMLGTVTVGRGGGPWAAADPSGWLWVGLALGGGALLGGLSSWTLAKQLQLKGSFPARSTR